MKFIHEGRVITIQSDRDVITSSELVLQISHSEDDLHLTGLHSLRFRLLSWTLVLSMMRGMSYFPGMGFGCRKQGPHEFSFTADHDTPYGLGYTPIEDDA